MWRNTVTAKFIEWLRDWNGRSGNERLQTGFFGMDLYSLHTSIESVLDYVERVDPAAARGARHRHACFEHFSHEPQAYGAATTYHGKVPCEDEVVSQLLELGGRGTAGDLSKRALERLPSVNGTASVQNFGQNQPKTTLARIQISSGLSHDGRERRNSCCP